jgi:hypothetical protein
MQSMHVASVCRASPYTLPVQCPYTVYLADVSCTSAVSTIMVILNIISYTSSIIAIGDSLERQLAAAYQSLSC